MEEDPEYFSESDNENDMDEVDPQDQPVKIIGKKKIDIVKADDSDMEGSDIEGSDEDESSINSNEDYEDPEDSDNEEEDTSFDKPKDIQNFPEIEDDDDEDENDEEDEDYLQKFDENIQKTIIQNYHPELQIHNYEEIESLCTIVKDRNGNIVDPLHRTIPFVSRYEYARILGERAKQINSGAEPFIEVKDEIIDGYIIALEEFKQKKIPFIIQRPLPSGGCEYWRVRDLELIQ